MVDGALDEFGGFFGGFGGDEDDGFRDVVDVVGGALRDDFGFAGAAVAAEGGLGDAGVEEDALGGVREEAEEFDGEGEGWVVMSWARSYL